MKKYLPLTAMLLLVFASVCFAQTAPQASPSPSPKPKPKMSKAQLQSRLAASEKKLWEAWKNKDTKPFKSALSADFVMIEENGVSGKDAVIKEITSMPCDVKSVELSNWKLTMLNSSTALLTYKGTAVGTCGGTAIPVVWASSIWMNRGGKWLAVSHQETPVKP
jgi:hypothetical protein